MWIFTEEWSRFAGERAGKAGKSFSLPRPLLPWIVICVPAGHTDWLTPTSCGLAVGASHLAITQWIRACVNAQKPLASKVFTYMCSGTPLPRVGYAEVAPREG